MVGGGNLALIYFNAVKEQSDARGRSRSSIPASSRRSPTIPVSGCSSSDRRRMASSVWAEDGIHFLDEDRVEGKDPLAVYGEHAVAAIRRLDAIEHVGDLAVISHYDPDTDRDLRVRGAHRCAWRPGWCADATVHPPPRGLGARPRADRRCSDGVPAAASLDGDGAGIQVRDHGPDDGVCGADRAHLAQAVMTAPTTRRLRVADRSAA